MVKISEKFAQITESKTLALTTLTQELRRKNIDVVSLGAGEPDFPTPENVKQAGITAIQENFTKYTPVDGIFDLKDAIIEWLEKSRGLKYDPAQIVVTNGAKHAVARQLRLSVTRGMKFCCRHRTGSAILK